MLYMSKVIVLHLNREENEEARVKICIRRQEAKPWLGHKAWKYWSLSVRWWWCRNRHGLLLGLRVMHHRSEVHQICSTLAIIQSPIYTTHLHNITYLVQKAPA
jgi:hypothetical protein